MYFYKRKIFIYFSVILAVIILLIVITSASFHENIINTQLLEISKAFVNSGNALSGTSVTLVLIIFSALISYFIFIMEFVLRDHILPFLLIMVLTSFGPLGGLNLDIYAIIFLSIFQASFIVINMTDSRVGKNSFIMKNRFSIAGKSGALVCASIIISLIICSPFVSANIDSLYTSVDNTEGFIYTALSNIGSSGTSVDFAHQGKINRGNVYTTGDKHLLVGTSNKPSERMYLKGFTGGYYQNGEWIESNETDIYHYISFWVFGNQFPENEETIRNIHYYMNLQLNPAQKDPNIINVKLLKNNMDTYYIPYYGVLGSGLYNNYFCEFYEQKDMNTARLSRLYYKDGSIGQSYKNITLQEINNIYIENIKSKYTSSIEEQFPRIAELCSENPLNNLEEVTAFIAYTLENNTFYTKTPGKAPENQDIIEYFLFDNNKGYCVHYASAAVMMYRMYGIPARYASGYVADPSSFKQEQYDYYSSEITDESAHAWVEIYLENYGWTPVDFTPSQYGMINAEYPGFNRETMEKIVKEHKWGLIATEDDDLSDSQEADDESFSSIPKWAVVLIVCISFVAVIIILFVLYVIIRKKYNLNRIRKMKSTQIFFMLIQMLHFSGMLIEYDGTESDFADTLSKELPDVEFDNISKAVDIAVCTEYGNVDESQNDRDFVKKIYFDVASKVYKRLKWYKKLLFRYLKFFI